MVKHLTSKGSIALRAGRANAHRCFGRYIAHASMELNSKWKSLSQFKLENFVH
jgi:hypothetical protein